MFKLTVDRKIDSWTGIQIYNVNFATHSKMASLSLNNIINFFKLFEPGLPL